jgi:hypothetical protein
MNASFSLLKTVVHIDFSNQVSEVAWLERHRVIVPTSTIPFTFNNTNSRPR